MTATATSLPAGEHFGDFDGRVWLNTAHQGPLPLAAAAEAGRAALAKTSPHRIVDEDFAAVPERLRELLARLVGADPEDVVLGDSTSHGLHLIANGLPFEPGDEVLVVAGDYPATVLPWMRLHDQGVTTHQLHPTGPALTAENVDVAITTRTRVLALTWVDSFTGYAVDLHAIGVLCRSRGVLFVVNASQALGARPLNVATTPVDAVVSCGYKWLCGPYGTGFTWLHPHLRDQLRPQQAYWLAMQAGRGLDQMRQTTLRQDLGVRALDRFCPANFLDVLPWIVSLDLVLRIGVEQIARHDQHLVDHLLEGLDPDGYRPVSPRTGPARSTLVVLSTPDGTAKARHQHLRDVGVDTAYREGNMRLSPHLFTSHGDIDRSLQALHETHPKHR